jgi:hypothetical protein
MDKDKKIACLNNPIEISGLENADWLRIVAAEREKKEKHPKNAQVEASGIDGTRKSQRKKRRTS